MKKDSIRISERYGVNPALLHCPLCGEAMGVALFGRLPHDAEAPHGVADTEPCIKCRLMMEKGILFVERSGNMITGNQWVVKREVIEEWAKDNELFADIFRRGYAHIEPDAAKTIGLYQETEDAN